MQVSKMLCLMVALLVSAWIEIIYLRHCKLKGKVALLVSAWIEITAATKASQYYLVALLVSAWIEIYSYSSSCITNCRRTPRECVD